MKKFIVYLFSIILIAGLTVMPTFSADLSELIKVYRNLANIEVNGTRVSTDNFLYNGTTYIPLRAVSELLDKEVGWDNQNKVASINDKALETEKLSQLLPTSVGYKWFYDGFAEYGHELELRQINVESQEKTYVLQGEVGDPSDGESNLDLNISMKYIIGDNRLIQEKTEEAMMDSKFDRLTLIKTPLAVGTAWQENVVDKSGKEVLINSYIKKIEITEEGKKQYTVRYQDTESNYYEERTLREGAGVVSFEKLLELKDSDFPVSYFLVNIEGLKNMQVNLYFPDKNAEKVHLEERTIQIHDAQVARGVVLALMRGPFDENLWSSIPEGTKLLNIYIQDRICYVDFSQEFIDNHPGGTAAESMTLASIINTLTEFDSIDKVQIMVEGKSGTTLGHIVLDKPLASMTDLIGD